MDKIAKQNIANKLGEITFRRKLTAQHLGKKLYFPGQPNKQLMFKTLKTRVSLTKHDFAKLCRKIPNLTPFLEIGAEKGQRSLYLTNELALRGFAGDISLESLQAATYYKKVLNYKKMPIRICLDAYHLPFKNNSIPFIFFYETLHHFPDPKPVLEEARRVLRSDGYIFFSEEPITQLLNLRMWRRDYCPSRLEKILKYILILPFLSTIGKSEVEHGILENTFWLDTWERSLQSFSECEVLLKPYPFGKACRLIKNKGNNWLTPDLLTLVFLVILGGGITALAKSNKSHVQNDLISQNLLSLLQCPDCENNTGLQKLQSPPSALICPKCKTMFKSRKGVYLLLRKKLKTKVYPNS